jgi:hypothetical protein
MPDAVTSDALHLIKNVSEMRLTYQIKLLAHMAKSCGKKLLITIPVSADVHSSLQDYVGDSGGAIEVKRV